MTIDAIGAAHPPIAPGEAVRIVSLVPSITELLCALGLAPLLVGRTGFCVHPRETLAAVPKVGGTKDVNVEKIRQLAPTHLVVNIDENDKPVVDALAAFIPHVIVTHPLAPRDNLALYRLLGGIFRAHERAETLCAEFEAEYAAFGALQPAPERRVLYCIWQDPWMTVSRDTYIARMLELIGWRQWQAASPSARYPVFTWSDNLCAEIDEVLLSTEPYRFTETHADALERQIGKPVRLVDGEMLSWYGSRAVAGLRYLRALRMEDA
ncbi:helical backbone metal receptor [Noviherbaspirillum pedocola]|uniref:ABC transporter substrate-binding protein n=1 Tax=Noviherbaspirillum pedocola TaxID=2801341 RepID=A0A934T3X4_9BURK|nr:helical backbone metal receptor [Noviherbaspirillum pedocola]MBK4738278.1 ABC transporter substrate-binding protein [Noviherbaspirillum pedocola]